MKKVLIIFAMLIALPMIKTQAQTSDENWVSLGEYLKDVYELQPDGTSKPKGWLLALLPKEESWDILRFVSKVAYKKNEGDFLPNTNLHINKLLKFDLENPEFDQNEIIISHGFDISQNGNKTKSKKIPVNDEGWKIFDLDGVGVITGVTGIRKEEGIDSPIFKNIYVALSPDKNPSNMAISKVQELRNEIDRNVFTTPQTMGWSPVKTEKLDDGTIVEHYDEGIRHFKKSNGDFISFKQLDDIRDSKTLDIKKGMDQDISNSSEKKNPIGSFQLTLPNGIVLIGNGITNEIRFNNGSKLVSDNDGSIYNPIELKNGTMAYPALLPISYATLLDYKSYDNVDSRFLKLPDDYTKRFNSEYVDLKFRPSDNGIKPLKFIYIEDDKPNKNITAVKAKINENSHDEYLIFTSPSKYEDICAQLYYPDDSGLSSYGFLESYKPYFAPLEIKEVKIEGEGYDKKIFFNFINGDYIIYGRSFIPSELHLTLKDGTIIEKFPDNRYYKLTFPNGDKYVGHLDLQYALNQLLFENDPNIVLQEGTLTTADGKKYEFANYINITKRDEEYAKLATAVQKALYSKYGKNDVDAALAGNIKIGMKIEMLKDMHIPLTLDDQSASYAWYKMATDITYHGNVKYRWIKVNKSTGKIDYIGSQRTGGFMTF